MPIFLPAPAHDPNGPDGDGWNRLSVNAHTSGARAQCALRPRSYPQLWESQDTRRARWGGYGGCVGDGTCGPRCPVIASRTRLRAFTPQVLVRLLPAAPGGPGRPHVMNRPGQGWDSASREWTWDALAALAGWRVGARHVDEHGEGFWLHAAGAPVNGVYG